MLIHETLKEELRKELVGHKEAAEILGWDKRKVATYKSRGSFPEPMLELAAGPLWLKSDILKYAAKKSIITVKDDADFRKFADELRVGFEQHHFEKNRLIETNWGKLKIALYTGRLDTLGEQKVMNTKSYSPTPKKFHEEFAAEHFPILKELAERYDNDENSISTIAMMALAYASCPKP